MDCLFGLICTKAKILEGMRGLSFIFLEPNLN